MKYVYILENEDGAHFYVGVTGDVQARVKAHNAGDASHTAKFGPWQVKTFIAFADDKRAFAFERYLNPGPVEPSRRSVSRHLSMHQPSLRVAQSGGWSLARSMAVVHAASRLRYQRECALILQPPQGARIGSAHATNNASSGVPVFCVY